MKLGRQLDSINQAAVLIHNDCLYLSREILGLAYEVCMAMLIYLTSDSFSIKKFRHQFLRHNLFCMLLVNISLRSIGCKTNIIKLINSCCYFPIRSTIWLFEVNYQAPWIKKQCDVTWEHLSCNYLYFISNAFKTI